MIAPDTTPPSPEAWQALPDTAVAEWVRRCEGSAALCLEATRRWFYFDHLKGGSPPTDPVRT